MCQEHLPGLDRQFSHSIEPECLYHLPSGVLHAVHRQLTMAVPPQNSQLSVKHCMLAAWRSRYALKSRSHDTIVKLLHIQCFRVCSRPARGLQRLRCDSGKKSSFSSLSNCPLGGWIREWEPLHLRADGVQRSANGFSQLRFPREEQSLTLEVKRPARLALTMHDS
jgi:hypothetical protein